MSSIAQKLDTGGYSLADCTIIEHLSKHHNVLKMAKILFSVTGHTEKTTDSKILVA